MRYSPEEVAMHEMGANQVDFSVSLSEGMASAAQDAWRTGATAALERGGRNFTDTSDEIDVASANEMYGLSGTEAEVQAGEKVTKRDMEARVKDYHSLKLNSFITETVNDDSPVMGRVSQFVAGMGASMIDPVTMAANIVGTGLISKAGQTLAASSKGLTAVAKLNKAFAKGIVSAYGEGASRSMMSIIAREGVENFVSSTIEETAIQTMDIGQEQLARKITVGDSIQNVIAGTVFGTTLGTVMSKDGREALGRVFSRQYGDDAADMAKSMHLVTAEEAKLGIEKSGIENKFYDRETFDARPWYNEAGYSIESSPTKMYLSLDAEGAVHSYSHRGDGVTMTANKIHAMNKGEKILEIDPANLRLIDKDTMFDAKGRPTKTATTIVEEMANDFGAKADPSTLGKILTLMKDQEAEIDDLKFNRSQSKKMLREALEGKNIDEIIDVMDGVAARHKLNYDPAMKLEELTEALGFNGYSFTGKNAQGQPAYKGAYVNKVHTKKLQKSGTFDVPKADEGSQILWKQQEEQLMHAHAKWLLNDAKSTNGNIRDPDYAGIPKETPVETAPKTPEGQAMYGTVEKQKSFDSVKSTFDAEIQKKLDEANTKTPTKEGDKAVKLEPEDVVDPELLSRKKIMELLQKGESHETIVASEMKRLEDWINCRMGV